MSEPKKAVVETKTVEMVHYNDSPLRLSFEPQAILEHFELRAELGRLQGLTEDELAAIGYEALDSDSLMDAFSDALDLALKSYRRNI